jgi:hypothetical protein
MWRQSLETISARLKGLLLGTWPRSFAIKRMQIISKSSSYRAAIFRNILKPDLTIQLLTNKLEVREYITETVGKKYCIPVIAVFRSLDEFINSELPSEYVIKPAHASGAVLIVKSGIQLPIHSKKQYGKWSIVQIKSSELDFRKDEMRSLLQSWLEGDYAFGPTKYPEIAYSRIERSLIVEPILKNVNNEIPLDFKFHYYLGSLKFIQVDYDRFTNHKRKFFDRDWNPLNATVIFPQGEIEIDKPNQLEEMLFVSSKLASGFDLVRIDFLITEDSLYVSEMSFFPDGGFGKFNSLELQNQINS